MAASSAAAAASLPPASDPPNPESVNQTKDTDSLKEPQSSANPPPLDASSADPKASNVSSDGISPAEEVEEEEEEEEECGFCLFMKGGGCKEPFIAWEKCVEEAEKTGDNVVDKCMEVTSLLKKCMDAHAVYYEPILKAEREMADAISEDEIDKEAENEVQK